MTNVVGVTQHILIYDVNYLLNPTVYCTHVVLLFITPYHDTPHHIPPTPHDTTSRLCTVRREIVYLQLLRRYDRRQSFSRRLLDDECVVCIGVDLHVEKHHPVNLEAGVEC